MSHRPNITSSLPRKSSKCSGSFTLHALPHATCTLHPRLDVGSSPGAGDHQTNTAMTSVVGTTIGMLLQALQPLFQADEEPGTRDNAAGAVSRMILALGSHLPLEQVSCQI